MRWKTLLRRILIWLVKPSIVFESLPPFTDNTRAVYDEMVRRGYDKKYRLAWLCPDGTCAFLKAGKVQYWTPQYNNSLFNLIRLLSVFEKTRCIVCCNNYITSSGDYHVTEGKGQVSIYLTHGTPIKSIKNYNYSCPSGIDYLISAAPALNSLMASEFGIAQEKVIPLGFPRNDSFAVHSDELRKKLLGEYSHLIVWYPTYRQRDNKPRNCIGSSMPIIHNTADAIRLNETAKACNTLIVFKPHFVQDVSLMRDLNLSNIRIIDDSYFQENACSSYQMLSESDALLTDYSSVYYDYTLADKPIGVIWEDIDSYRDYPGFAVDLDHYMKGAEKIYHVSELCDFVNRVANGVDLLMKERRGIRDEVNLSSDGKNAARVVDFISEMAKL